MCGPAIVRAPGAACRVTYRCRRCQPADIARSGVQSNFPDRSRCRRRGGADRAAPVRAGRAADAFARPRISGIGARSSRSSAGKLLVLDPVWNRGVGAETAHLVSLVVLEIPFEPFDVAFA